MVVCERDCLDGAFDFTHMVVLGSYVEFIKFHVGMDRCYIETTFVVKSNDSLDHWEESLLFSVVDVLHHSKLDLPGNGMKEDLSLDVEKFDANRDVTMVVNYWVWYWYRLERDDV